MKHYVISQPKEFGTHFRGDEVYLAVNIKDIDTNVLSDPSDVLITIYYPCGTIASGPTSMDTTTTGVYTYDYSIPSSTALYPFGVYRVAIETVNYKSMTQLEFVVFPWDVLSRVREVSGAYQQSDMSDYKLAKLAWASYMETLDDIFEHVYDERPLPNPTTCVFIDGANVDFQTRKHPLADHNGDEQVTGPYQTACGADISVYYIDDDGLRYEATATVENADDGHIKIATYPVVAPLPTTVKKLAVEYYVESPNYNKNLMHEAVAYLTAYKVALAFRSLQKATVADLQSNRDNIAAEMFLERYQSIVEHIGFPNIGAGK